MSFTSSQRKALAIIPRITGTLSLLGSGSILYDLLRDRKKLERTYYRLLFAFSFFDSLTSIAGALSTWPIPKGTEGIFGARGSTGTCTAQGFFIQLATMSPMYNSMLAVYYLLVVKYGVAEQDIARKYEPFMHAFPLLVAPGMALVGLILELYNNANLWCWIAPYPAGCQGSRGQDGPTECERGYNFWIYRWVFFYGPIWFTIVFISVVMIVIWMSVRRDEARAIESSFLQGHIETNPDVEIQIQRRSFDRSRKMLVQSLCYAGAFYVTWTPATVNRLLQLFTGNVYFVPLALTAFLAPLQGFWNFLVYRHGPCIG